MVLFSGVIIRDLVSLLRFAFLSYPGLFVFCLTILLLEGVSYQVRGLVLVSMLKGISNLMDYLMPNPYL